MVEVYTLNIKEHIAVKDYEKLLKFVSKEKRSRISKFHFIDDAKRSLYSEVLIRNLICKKLHILNEQIIFQYNEHMKPYLSGYLNYHFNISHSGDWVVCVTSEREVGIDIEQIKPIDLNIAKRFFAKQEYEDLLQYSADRQIKYFYNLWTLKESYIKYKGKGLSIPLNSFSFNIRGVNILVKSEDHDILQFKQYEIDKGYALSVCAEEYIFIENIHYLNLKDLFY